MRRSIAGGLAVLATTLLAVAWLSSDLTTLKVNRVQEVRTRLDRLTDVPLHRPPELAPPPAPGPGVTG